MGRIILNSLWPSDGATIDATIRRWNDNTLFFTANLSIDYRANSFKYQSTAKYNEWIGTKMKKKSQSFFFLLWKFLYNSFITKLMRKLVFLKCYEVNILQRITFIDSIRSLLNFGCHFLPNAYTQNKYHSKRENILKEKENESRNEKRKIGSQTKNFIIL